MRRTLLGLTLLAGALSACWAQGYSLRFFGNGVIDRDRFGQDRKFGISVAGGRIVFGGSGNGAGDFTICGTSNVLDGQWHHIALDEVRLSTVLRYASNFTSPTQPFVADSATAALYHFDEGAGVVILDSANASGGPSDGELRYSGNPTGPIWTADTPFRRSGDVDGNGCVDDADLLQVLFAFGGAGGAADVNSDGVVDDPDLLIVLFQFGNG